MIPWQAHEAMGTALFYRGVARLKMISLAKSGLIRIGIVQFVCQRGRKTRGCGLILSLMKVQESLIFICHKRHGKARKDTRKSKYLYSLLLRLHADDLIGKYVSVVCSPLCIRKHEMRVLPRGLVQSH